MSEHFRGELERNTSRWLRGRWKYRSVLVLDVDNIVCTYEGDRGLLIEWKHVEAKDKTWRITALLGEKLGWHAALFVYETADGTDAGEITRIDAIWRYQGREAELHPLNPAAFDNWVCGFLGAEPPLEGAA